MNYRLIDDKVLEIYVECNIREFPIDCMGILQHYNFRLLAYSKIKNENPELHKIAKEYSNDAFQYGRIICYNDAVVEGRMRFSLMHELGHYLLKHKETTPENEAEADYFASCVLAPKVAIWRLPDKTSDAIHNKFGLSYAASNRVLTEFNRWKFKRNHDSELKLGEFLFPTNKPATKKNVKNKAERKSRHQQEWAEIESRNRFIEECYGDLTEYALMQYEASLHLGHPI